MRATEASPIAQSGLPAADSALPIQSQQDRGVTLRVVVLSLLLAAVLGYAIPVIDFKLFNTFLGATHLPPGAVGVLLALVLIVNPVLRLVSQRWGLTRNEVLTVYITCLFSSLVPGHGAENFIVPHLISSFYFATRENKWLEFLQPYVKPWMTPALTGNGEVNRAVTDGWYVGLGSGGAIPWQAWLVPLAFWITFVLISYTMLGCLSVMLRAQWAEKEALAFPLLRLPLQMTEDLDRTDIYGTLGHFFRNPVMWIGFGIAVFIQMLRGLNLYFPEVPTFPLEIDTSPLRVEAPWNQTPTVPIAIFPMVVGIAYLLTTEVSFSLWFFFWFAMLQYIVAYYIGLTPTALPASPYLPPGRAFTGYQMIGCYVAYVGLVLWTAREHLRHVARRAFGRAPATPGEKEEVLSYPVALWGFVLSFAAMVGLTCLAGARLDVALVMWITYLVFAIGLTRVIVEGGMLGVQHQSLPLGVVARLFNTGPSP